MLQGREEPIGARPNVILGVLLLAGLAYAVLSSAVIPALTTIQHDLGTTETGVAWLLTGFLLSASVGTAIIGRLGDMYGKERLLLWTLLVIGGLIAQHPDWHWLFWLPLAVTLLAAFCTWRYIPESPVRTPGHVNWLAAALMSTGVCGLLIGIAQTTVWGWGDTRTLFLFAAGIIVCVAWVAVEVRSREPLVDMAMMRVRGLWTTNLTAFLLGAGLYAE
jgi:MFS family permease